MSSYMYPYNLFMLRIMALDIIDVKQHNIIWNAACYKNGERCLAAFVNTFPSAAY